MSFAPIDEIVAELSRIRLLAESLGPQTSEAQRDLATHLTLASMAALRLRFANGGGER